MKLDGNILFVVILLLDKYTYLPVRFIQNHNLIKYVPGLSILNFCGLSTGYLILDRESPASCVGHFTEIFV